MEKYGFRNVFDIKIYDYFGKYVTELNTLKATKLTWNKDSGTFWIRDALLDRNLLTFISGPILKEDILCRYAA